MDLRPDARRDPVSDGVWGGKSVHRTGESRNATRPTMPSTYFGLLAEFGTANLPLDKVALAYFGYDPKFAARCAVRKSLPVPAFRLAGQKSPWLIAAQDLADWIDKARAASQHEYARMRS